MVKMPRSMGKKLKRTRIFMKMRKKELLKLITTIWFRRLMKLFKK